MSISSFAALLSVFALCCIPDVSSYIHQMYCNEKISEYDSGTRDNPLKLHIDTFNMYYPWKNRMCKQIIKGYGWVHVSWKFTKFNGSSFCTSRLQIHSDKYHTDFLGCGTLSRELNKEYTLDSGVVYITVEVDYRKDHNFSAEIEFYATEGYCAITIACAVCGSLVLIFIIILAYRFKKKSSGTVVRTNTFEIPCSEGAVGYEYNPEIVMYPRDNTSSNLTGDLKAPPPSYETLFGRY